MVARATRSFVPTVRAETLIGEEQHDIGTLDESGAQGVGAGDFLKGHRVPHRSDESAVLQKAYTEKTTATR